MFSRGVFFHFFSIQNTHLEDSGSEIDLDDASTDQAWCDGRVTGGGVL